MSMTAPAFLTLEAALNDLGQAWVAIGNPFSSGGMSILGLTPGEITPAMNPQYQQRIYEEYSRQPVQAKLVGCNPEVTIPLVWGDPTVYAKVNPLGAKWGGHATPQDITYTTLVLIPQSEANANWVYGGGSWTYPVGGPVHSIWFPKGYFDGAFPTFGSLVTENKNRTGSVTFRGVLASASNWPDGRKSWVIGDPITAGVTGLAI
jgi:hypothetical protein